MEAYLKKSKILKEYKEYMKAFNYIRSKEDFIGDFIMMYYRQGKLNMENINNAIEYVRRILKGV